MPSIQNLLLRQLFKISGKNKTAGNHSLGKSRKQLNNIRYISKLPSKVNYKSQTIATVFCEWAQAKKHKTKGVVLYFHGGAYISGSVETHKALVGRIARASQTNCLSVNYRLAPEHP